MPMTYNLNYMIGTIFVRFTTAKLVAPSAWFSGPQIFKTLPGVAHDGFGRVKVTF